MPENTALSNAIIHYNEQYNVTICKSCGIGVNGYYLQRHLSERNHGYRFADLAHILEALKSKPQRLHVREFPIPPNGLPPIQYLKVFDGFECNVCGFLTRSLPVIHKKHMSEHRDVLGPISSLYHSVKIQVNTLSLLNCYQS